MWELQMNKIFYPIALLLNCLMYLSLVIIARRVSVSWWKRKKVAVVVLGDIGRSPRMQYHSLSLASHEFDVHLMGFAGSIPHSTILECDRITLHHVKEVVIKRFPKLVNYVLKVVLQFLCLLKVFIWDVGATEFILMQNPPCIPGLVVCLMMSLINGSKLIIDWHNYAYSILAMSLGKEHKLVRICKWYEETFGQLASGNFCVTHAMSDDLQNRWQIHAKVLHDRPGPLFKPINDQQRHRLYNRLAESYPEFKAREGDVKGGNRLTYLNEQNEVVQKADCPAIIISSTSWTEDEDFSILIAALEKYNKLILEQVAHDHRFNPDILCVVTGKGPLKEYYKGIIAQKDWKHVQVVTPWLEAEDYPRMLAASDYGVSLHTSSSGLDLPMKVVDMFGSSLPVIAINFKCLNELVVHEETGMVFEDADSLLHQLQILLNKYKRKTCKARKYFCQNIKDFRKCTWVQNWDAIALPFFKKEQ